MDELVLARPLRSDLLLWLAVLRCEVFMIYQVKDAKGRLRKRKFDKLKQSGQFAQLEIYQDAWARPIAIQGG